MNDDQNDSLEDLDCDVLVSAGASQVAISRSVHADYDELEDKKKGRFQRIMELWCEEQKLSPEMFNGNEGRSPRHNHLLQAFKAFKVRLYGIVRSVRGVRTFIILDTDPAKKQDKADPGVLKRAKGRADQIGKRK